MNLSPEEVNGALRELASILGENDELRDQIKELESELAIQRELVEEYEAAFDSRSREEQIQRLERARDRLTEQLELLLDRVDGETSGE